MTRRAATRRCLTSGPRAAAGGVLCAAWLGLALVPRDARAQEPSFWNLGLRAERSPAAGLRYGDVWGAEGRVLLATFQSASGSGHGVYILDARGGDSLALAGYLPTLDPPRDVTAADTLCLLVFEPGSPDPPHPAVLLASIADPSAPRVLGTFRSDSVSQVHNAALSPPYAFLACTSTGDLRILDVSDPRGPREVGRWSTGAPQRYLHDVTVLDTLAFLSYWEQGLRVLSVADPARPYELGRFLYPGARAHSVAISEDGTTAYLADEIFDPPYGHLRVLDITDLSDIREVGTWISPKADASVHNVAVLGERLYVAHYASGVRVLDIANPRAPVEIAFADVDPPTDRLTGFWGVFPAAPDGDVVYASHMDRGAFLLELRAFRTRRVALDGSVEFTSIQGALDASGPGDTVRVAPGVYRERVVMRSGVALLGAGAERTVVDAEGAGRPLVIRTARPGTRVAGLALTGGRAVGGAGGGGLVVDRSAAVVESVAVFGNAAEGAGGGVLVIGGEPALRGMRIVSNHAGEGGGLALFGVAPDDSAVAAAESRGEQAAVGNASPETRCGRRGGGGGRSARTRSGLLVLEDVRLTDNVAEAAGGGIVVRTGAALEAARTVVARNGAPRGGGAAAFDAPWIVLTNCTVAWNRAAEAGGGLYAEDSDFQVENGVVADNAAPVASAFGGTGAVGAYAEFRDAAVAGNRGSPALSADRLSAVTFSASLVHGNGEPLVGGSLAAPDTSGGNLFADPLFVAPTWEALDYLPGIASPLIDAGIPWDEEADLDGTRQDIGVGGGPRSGWVAPRFTWGPVVRAEDNFEVVLSWWFADRARDSSAVFRGLVDPVPLDSANRLRPDQSARGRGGIADTSLGPQDTLVFYRVVPADSAGHAGSPSATLAARPTNQPPSFDISLRASEQSGEADSLRIRVFGREGLYRPSLIVNESEVEPIYPYGDISYVEARVPEEGGPLRILVRVEDRYGLSATDSLVAMFARLDPRSPVPAGDLSGAFRFVPVGEGDARAVLIRTLPALPSLPNGQVPLSDRFIIDEISYGIVWDSLDVWIQGPPEFHPPETIVIVGGQQPTVTSRADVSTYVRNARIEYREGYAITLFGRANGAAWPAEIRFSGPAPNPSRGETHLRIDLDREIEGIVVEVFDTSGRRIRRLFAGDLPPGFFELGWDGKDDGGRDVPSGHYFLRGSAVGQAITRRVVLVR